MKRLVSSALGAMMLMPSMAFADPTFGDSAAAELNLLIPQSTIVGLGVVAVVGVLVGIFVVINMMKRV